MDRSARHHIAGVLRSAAEALTAKLSKSDQNWWLTAPSGEPRFLQRMLEGKPTVLYHGTTADFSKFSPSRTRTELVDRFYGAGIFLTPSKDVARRYANANRNAGFPVNIIRDFAKVNPRGAAFMLDLVKNGAEVAFERIRPDITGADGYVDYDLQKKLFKGVDLNTVSDVAEMVAAKNNKARAERAAHRSDQPINIFDTSTGMPDWIYDAVDELGLDSKKYRPKVMTVMVSPLAKVLVTDDKQEARKARSQGYDGLIFMGDHLVNDVPEVAVFDPGHLKIIGSEVD